MNTMGLLMDAWYTLLSGLSVPVYKEDAPEDVSGNYVLIRAEGETYSNNKQKFADESVVVIDIVTEFKNNIDRSIVEGIDTDIRLLVFPTISSIGLINPSGVQILNVKRETSSYLPETDGINKYYRKISRYTHRISQN